MVQKFEEYMRNCKKKKAIKFNADGLPIDNLGETDGVIRLSAPRPDGKGKGAEEDTHPD